MTSQHSINICQAPAWARKCAEPGVGLNQDKAASGTMGGWGTVTHPGSQSTCCMQGTLILPTRADIWGQGSHPQGTGKACRALREKQAWSFQKVKEGEGWSWAQSLVCFSPPGVGTQSQDSAMDGTGVPFTLTPNVPVFVGVCRRKLRLNEVTEVGP